MSRVSKKISVLDSVEPSASILVLNLFDPQINTFRAMLHYVEEKGLPFFIVANKRDKVGEGQVSEALSHFDGRPIVVGCMLSGDGVKKVKGEIRRRFKPGSRIVVLGVFNSGKSSLIRRLTNNHDIFVSDLPGSTLSYLEYNYGRSMKLIDSVGQIIDVNKPLMVSVDLEGCETTEEKLRKVMLEDAYGIMNSVEMALPGLVRAVEAIRDAVDKGGKVVVTGAGASALVGMEFAGQGFETGLPVYCLTNNMADAHPVSFAKGLGESEGGLSRYIAGIINEGDVILGVSASGGTGFVYDVLAKGRERGATTIAVTENPDTPMGRHADIVIKSNAKPEGPCLHPDTLVLTEADGLKKVKHVKPGERVLTVRNSPSHQANLRFHGSTGFQIRGLKWGRIKQISKTGADHLYKIRYRNGGVLETTGEHELLVCKSAGVYPVKASEIEEGDILAGLPEDGLKNIGSGEKLDHRLLELLGYYTAEGSTGTRSLIFTLGGHENELSDRIISLMSDRFNANHRVVEKHGGSAVDLWFYSSKATELFKRTCGKGAKNKHIPKALWNGDISSFRTYIKAYAEGDGYLTKDNKMRMRSVSKRLIEELAWLTRLHNIPCSINEMKQPERKIRDRKIPEGIIWQLQIGRNGWKKLISENEEKIVNIKTPKGIYERDLNKPIRYTNRVISVEKIPYQGPVYDLVDCEGDVFYAGNIPALVHNSSSKIQAAHLAIVHALAVTLASDRGVDAEDSIKFMLPEFIPTKKMGIK